MRGARARRGVAFAALLLALPLATSCQRGPSRDPAHRQRENDAQMRAAEARGQRELSRFLLAFAKPEERDEDWRFRARFAVQGDPEATPEDLWFRLEKIEGGKLVGRLVNRPHRVKHLVQHQQVAVDRGQVNDWSFVRGGYLEGAFTIRVIYSRMNDAERRAYTRAQPRPFARLTR